MLASTVATLQDNSAHGEDSYLVRDLGDNGFLDAVMDGVTGHGGAEASRSVYETLSEAAISCPQDVVAALEDLNYQFYMVGRGRFLLTTASVVLYAGGKLYVISAGDSPAYLVHQDSYKQMAGSMGGLLRLGLTRSIGAASSLEVNRMEATVGAGDRLVLSTDGVTDNIRAGELIDVVRNGASPEKVTNRISQLLADKVSTEGTHRFGGRYRHDDQTTIIRFFAPE